MHSSHSTGSTRALQQFTRNEGILNVKRAAVYVVVFAVLLVLPWLFGRAWEIVNPQFFVYVRASRRGTVIFVAVCGVVAYFISELFTKYVFRAGR